MYNSKVFVFLLFFCGINISAFAVDADLNNALNNARTACVGISDKMADIKRMAGINTAITGVGTASGAVAFGTGIAKASTDRKAEQIEDDLRKLIEELRKKAENQDTSKLSLISITVDDIVKADLSGESNASELKQKQQELEQLTDKSKTLGNVRTGTMAVAGATNVAGAIIAGKNVQQDDLETKIENCAESIKNLQAVQMQVQMDNNTDDATLSRAKDIISKCSMIKTIDLSSVIKKAKGAMVGSAVGATTGVVGTITSVLANNKNTRDDNSEEGKKKEKNLNTASNVLAGATTVASATATVFNATQISAIKNMSKIVDDCEGAF